MAHHRILTDWSSTNAIHRLKNKARNVCHSEPAQVGLVRSDLVICMAAQGTLDNISCFNISSIHIHSIYAFRLIPLNASMMPLTSAIPFSTRPSRICRGGNASRSSAETQPLVQSCEFKTRPIQILVPVIVGYGISANV